AVGIRPRDCLGADIGGAAAAVLDHHLLAPNVGELAGDDAGDGVGSPAGRERHDQPHEAVRPIRAGRSLRERAPDAGRQRRRPGERNGVAAGDHSLTLILAALMTGAHFSISVLRWAPSSSGEEPTAITPS